MKKILKYATLALAAILFLALAGITLFGGAVIKRGVNTFGPAVMGVPVTLADASLRPFSGKARLTKLHVGNPEGFKTPALFTLGDVDIELNVRSLFSDTIIIHKIFINAPEITYERGLLSSNFGKLLKQLEGGDKGAETAGKAGAPAKEDAGGGKKVIIEELVVRDPRLNVSVTAAGGHYIPVALGQVEIRDIGKKSGGATFADAIRIIFSVLTQNIENAVAGAGDLVGSGVKAVGGAAGEGAKALGGAISEGASAVGKTLGGLLGGKKEEKKREPGPAK
jgi:hypothetical protein